MKKIIPVLSLLFLIQFIFPSAAISQGVASLKVIEMAGFPDLPTDSAYGNQVYNFNVVVFNNSNQALNSTLDIQMKVDSVETTLVSDPQPFLFPGDTLTISVTNFSFSPVQFLAGNNIVVVWPRVNGSSIPIDSFFTAIYFVPLSSLGDGTFEDNSMYFNVYPVPSGDYINILEKDGKAFEYVRIFDVTGKLISDKLTVFNNQLYVGNLSPGQYLVEVGYEKKRYCSKFLKE